MLAVQVCLCCARRRPRNHRDPVNDDAHAITARLSVVIRRIVGVSGGGAAGRAAGGAVGGAAGAGHERARLGGCESQRRGWRSTSTSAVGVDELSERVSNRVGEQHRRARDDRLVLAVLQVVVQRLVIGSDPDCDRPSDVWGNDALADRLRDADGQATDDHLAEAL